MYHNSLLDAVQALDLDRSYRILSHYFQFGKHNPVTFHLMESVLMMMMEETPLTNPMMMKVMVITIVTITMTTATKLNWFRPVKAQSNVELKLR